MLSCSHIILANFRRCAAFWRSGKDVGSLTFLRFALDSERIGQSRSTERTHVTAVPPLSITSCCTKETSTSQMQHKRPKSTQIYTYFLSRCISTRQGLLSIHRLLMGSAICCICSLAKMAATAVVEQPPQSEEAK